MENWLTHIDNLFTDIKFDKVDIEQTDFYTFKTYRKDGTYITVDLIDEFKTIRKIEFTNTKSYWKCYKR